MTGAGNHWPAQPGAGDEVESAFEAAAPLSHFVCDALELQF